MIKLNKLVERSVTVVALGAIVPIRRNGGQPERWRDHYEHTHGKLTKEKAGRVFPLGGSREWYHDETHEQINQNAEPDTADESVAN